jgi:putative intracellular protease/amidase
MKRSILWAFLTVVLIVVSLLSGCAKQPRILLYTREGSGALELMLREEVEVMIRLLEEAGLRVEIATLYEEPYYGAGVPFNFKPDLLLEDVKVSKYAGFLLPCMAAGQPGIIEARAVEMVREAAARGKPVAAQHGSIHTLARAGLLEGRRYAMGLAVFPEGIYSGTGVVRDGNIITSGICPEKTKESGRPNGTVELTRELIEAVLH